MDTQLESADEARINRARAHATQHRLDVAEMVYRDILIDAPDTPEALNFVALCELSRGNFASAQQALEHAAHLDPTEAEIWKTLGIVQLAQHHGDDALDAFDRALGIEPMHFESRLHRGAALEQLGRLDEATAAYFGALAVAQSRGKWRNDMTTPPGLRPVVRHAIEFVDRHRRRIFTELLQPLRERFGAASLARVEQGLAIYLDDVPDSYIDPRQTCTFFHVPNLCATPFHAREHFPWQDELERHAEAIRADLLAVLAQPIGVEPFLGSNDNKVLREQNLLAGDDGRAAWNAFFFWRHGEVQESNAKRCPRTAEILADLPAAQLHGLSPEILFSMLDPGTHVLERHGASNARLLTHLPLRVPPDCAISVGGIEHSWQPDHCVTFDETFAHTMHNRSDQPCAVLALDSWHPGLSEAERAAIALLFDGFADFNINAKVAGQLSD